MILAIHKGYPNEYSNGGDARSFLAGNFNQWTTTEIEVFQIVQ